MSQNIEAPSTVPANGVNPENTRSNMRPLSWLFGLAAIPQASGASALRDVGRETQPLPPSKDPWYTPPPGFETKAPGDILRIRPAPGNLTSVVSNTSAAYHILFRTTDARDEPSWAVTSLFIPPSVYFSPSGKAALLSYQFAYNTANLDSCPSIGLYWRLAQDDPNLGIKSSTSLISEFLSRGWMVNTPDYLGPSSAFGSSVQAGHATLDSIRTVLNLGNVTGSSEISAAMWGYSGGSIATGAAAELQPSYAPELEIPGTVLGGLVDDLSADLDLINKSPIAGTLIAFLLGVTAQFPEARAYLESKLVEDTKEEFMSVLDINVADAVKAFAGRDIYAYFKSGAADLRAPILTELYASQTRLGWRGVPRMPIFVYKAIGDQLCPIDQTDATMKRWCESGAEISYERNTVGEHISEIENGKPRAMRWLWSVFDETYQPVVEGCTSTDVSVDVSAEGEASS